MPGLPGGGGFCKTGYHYYIISIKENILLKQDTRGRRSVNSDFGWTSFIDAFCIDRKLLTVCSEKKYPQIAPNYSRIGPISQNFLGAVAPDPTWGAYSAPRPPAANSSLRSLPSLRSAAPFLKSLRRACNQ